jgi:hypothetical protein
MPRRRERHLRRPRHLPAPVLDKKSYSCSYFAQRCRGAGGSSGTGSGDKTHLGIVNSGHWIRFLLHVRNARAEQL